MIKITKKLKKNDFQPMDYPVYKKEEADEQDIRLGTFVKRENTGYQTITTYQSVSIVKNTKGK